MTDEPSRQHYNRAVVSFEQGRWVLAIKEFQQHLATWPRDSDALAMMAAALVNHSPKNASAARGASAAALEIAPDSVYCIYIRAIVAQHIDLDRQPEKTFRISRRSRKPVERMHVARKIAMSALERDPSHLPSWHLLASIAQSLGEANAMLRASQRALAIAPQDVHALQQRAEALRMGGNADASVAAVEQALAIDPERAALHELRGWQLLQAGEIDAARGMFSESLRRDPRASSPKTGLEQARWARFALYRWPMRFWLWRTAGRGRSVGLQVLILFVLGGSMIRSQLDPKHPENHVFGFILLAFWAIIILMVIICPWPFTRVRES